MRKLTQSAEAPKRGRDACGAGVTGQIDAGTAIGYYYPHANAVGANLFGRHAMATPYVEEGPDGLVFVDGDGRRHAAYLMKPALDKVGISESTYYRWIRSGQVMDVQLRNRANWRIFTDRDVERLQREAARSKRP